jgi:hypothetical protein
MDMIQYVLLIVGVVIALSSFWDKVKSFFNGIMNFINPTVEPKVTPTVPEVILPPPVQSTTTTTTTTVETLPAPISIDVPEEELDEVRLVDIIVEWEYLVDLLERSEMSECNVDMKKMLIKMATEYRSDLNEVKKVAEKE